MKHICMMINFHFSLLLIFCISHIFWMNCMQMLFLLLFIFKEKYTLHNYDKYKIMIFCSCHLIIANSKLFIFAKLFWKLENWHFLLNANTYLHISILQQTELRKVYLEFFAKTQYFFGQDPFWTGPYQCEMRSVVMNNSLLWSV